MCILGYFLDRAEKKLYAQHNIYIFIALGYICSSTIIFNAVELIGEINNVLR